MLSFATGALAHCKTDWLKQPPKKGHLDASEATSTRIRFHIVSGNGAIVFYSLEDGEQYKNARKTYTCGRGLREPVYKTVVLTKITLVKITNIFFWSKQPI